MMNVQRPSPIVPLSIQEGVLAIRRQHLFYRRIAPPFPSGSAPKPSLVFLHEGLWLSESFQNWNIEDCLDRITCPALVMQGRQDPYGSERQGQSIVAGVGLRARAILIPGGHALQRDALGIVRQVIAAFVEAL